MNKIFSSIRKYFSGKRFKYGGYALVMTIVGIAVIVLLNVGMTILDENYNLKIDTSQNKTYTLTEPTKKLAASLTKDIYIYTTYTSGSETQAILEILEKIKALSPRIHLENRDTVKEPQFSAKYTKNGQSVTAGDIIVSDAESKIYKILGTSAQYTTQYDQTTGESTGTQITVEGSVVTAMNYINLGYMPTVFLAQGHGELGIGELGDINNTMAEWNYNLETLSISQNPEKIKTGDIILFANPRKDLTDEERATLSPLLEKGGRFYFLFDPSTTDMDSMPNFAALLKQFDISLKKGVVVENDPGHYFTANAPAYLVPDLQSHTITDQITNKNIKTVIPISGALQLPDKAPDSATTITSLLTSSDKSYLKALTAESLEQEAADETGPFDLACAVEKKVGSDEADSVKVVIVYNTEFAVTPNISDLYNNMSFFMYGTAWMRNAEKDIVVTPKLFSTAYFNIQSAAQFYTITVFAIGFVPILMIIAAIIVYTKRKHL
jgi:ABC-2 type transport system permease protein